LVYADIWIKSRAKQNPSPNPPQRVPTESNRNKDQQLQTEPPAIKKNESDAQQSPSDQTRDPQKESKKEYQRIDPRDGIQDLLNSKGEKIGLIDASSSFSDSEQILYKVSKSTDSNLVSAIVEIITLSGKQPSDKIIICLKVTDDYENKVSSMEKKNPPHHCQETEVNSCLAYREEESKEFECEDSSLEEKEIGGDRFLCGKTPHLTSFGVLLSTSSTNECEPYMWVSLALLIAAIVLSILFIVLGVTYQPLIRVIYGKEGYSQVEFRDKLETLQTNSQKP